MVSKKEYWRQVDNCEDCGAVISECPPSYCRERIGFVCSDCAEKREAGYRDKTIRWAISDAKIDAARGC